jgi:integrase
LGGGPAVGRAFELIRAWDQRAGDAARSPTSGDSYPSVDIFPQKDHYSDSVSLKAAFVMGNPSPSRGPSTIVNRTVTPRRRRNADLREREYLTPKEVERLQDAARKHSRYGHRDATAILIAYRHGLRASELCELTWNMIELDSGRIHVRRAKNGVDSTHPLTGKEIRALRQLRRENLQGRYVFNTERGGPVTRAWFLKMIRRTGELAKLPFPIHPHMLRHGCGFKLANDGVDTRALQHFLGHRNIMHTVRYTELRSDRFDGFWKD